ncbi:MAG: LysR family transcriptional regulator [Pseudomonadota bacterium]|jgi:LysR family transcriptional activator of nhaA|nr:LysR family transcriptional regulator [Rubrivivax sp.]MCA3257812.1 LysR family transcriptional regulator [Rubrivivax sp.]MCE2913220.1 LysR family transcriptional regulator [Rubrivivax sp.]MCZ8030564.1 LysR family transcriptional regulator [Rubrivivax sp.]
MDQLNYKHLHYFWVVAKSGGVAKAGERLHVTPQSISTQMRQLESVIGAPLWRRAGRRLELTETGHLVLEHAERMFEVGEALKDALRGQRGGGTGLFRVGVTGSVVKVVAYRMLEPALAMHPAPRMLCREGRFNELLALLAVHELDLVLSDRPLPASMHVRGFNHLLLESGVTFLATSAVAKPRIGAFPHSLDGAPMLLPGGDSAVRAQLVEWFDRLRIQPRVVADFDDTAVMKAFGQGGAGVFPMPTIVAAETAAQYRVVPVGRTDDVRYQLYAVSTERRLTHPAVVAIRDAARERERAQASVSPPA